MRKERLMLFLMTALCLQLPSVMSTCTTALQTSERSSQAVELKFYRILSAEWNDKTHSSKVAVQVSNFANTYCAANPSACGMETCCSGNTTFKDTNIGIVSVTDDRKDMKLKLYLELPSGANATGTLQCVVGMGALQEIVGNARDQIHTETGSWITYVDDIFYGIPPASDLNRILIPVAFVILFLICLIALILHFWNKRKEELEKKRKFMEKRKATSKKKAEPRYDVDTSDPKVPHGVDGQNGAHAKPKRKDELYRERMRQSASTKKTGSTISDSGVRVDTELRHRQAQALTRTLQDEPVKSHGATNYAFDEKTERLPRKEPASDGMKPPGSHLAPINADVDTDDGQADKKKKKKKKKHRSKSGEIKAVSDIGNGTLD